MQTTRNLRSIKQLSRVDRLLHAFTTSSAGLSELAYLVRDWAELPQSLRDRVSQAERIACSWECWSDQPDFWLFTADMALPLSRERGSPVLRICRFREDGQLHDAGHWVSDRELRWRKIAD